MKPLSIAQIASADEGGGAATVARGLMRGYAARGHRVWQVVGRKRGDDPNVVLLPDDDRPAYRMTGYTAAQRGLRRLAARFPHRGFGLISRSLRLAAHPRVIRSRQRGLEDFDFPGSAGCIDRLSSRPDVVHGHNLQGDYFDLRALMSISARVPTMLTLHDMWLLTGHCAYSLGCDRWKRGCGDCPDLHLDPPIQKDATRENLRRKQDVAARSALHIVTPSRWLADHVRASLLAPAIKSLTVIPNGVDTTIFHPRNRTEARAALGLRADAHVVLLTTGSHGSMWKDDGTLKEVVRRLSARPGSKPIQFVAVGRESAVVAGSQTISVRFQHDAREIATYFQAADLYLHAARADTCPLTVLEAMACGTPVVASRIGGIPEQIDDASGVLVAPRNGAEMAEAVECLLADAARRSRMGEGAARTVLEKFTLDRQVNAYLACYRDLLDEFQPRVDAIA
jgi:glycosyltransferase involved in cell wall biosynthesis